MDNDIEEVDYEEEYEGEQHEDENLAHNESRLEENVRQASYYTVNEVSKQENPNQYG